MLPAGGAFRYAPPTVRWLSSNPEKRSTERALLGYSPLWIAVISYVMFGGAFRHWGDAEHLLLGVGLALPPWLLMLRSRHARRAIGLITLYSFVQCWFGSKLFFESFGMEYHFHVSARFTWNGTPAFLYFLTVAYFCTYYTALVILWRAFRTRYPAAPRPLRLLVRALLSYAVAFAETATMANHALADYFSYRDPGWVMRYGSICYGTIFFITLPQFYDLDEHADTGESAWRLTRDALAYNLLILICYEGYAWLIARVT